MEILGLKFGGISVGTLVQGVARHAPGRPAEKPRLHHYSTEARILGELHRHGNFRRGASRSPDM